MKKPKLKDINETEVYFENEQTAMPFDDAYKELLRKTVLECLKSEDIEFGCEVNILITDDRSIHEINRQFRNIDRPTDVLSFPMADMVKGKIVSPSEDYDRDKDLLMLGDIVISTETAIRQAEEYGHSLQREITFLTSHGMFHLLGYDHIIKDDEEVMMSKQESVLEKLGLKRNEE
jgi:probable rRNA maturation factor